MVVSFRRLAGSSSHSSAESTSPGGPRSSHGTSRGSSARAPSSGTSAPRGAREQHRVAAVAAVARGEDVAAALPPRRDDAVDGGRREVGPVGEDDDCRLHVLPRAPRARSAATRPGPRSQSAQWTTRASASSRARRRRRRLVDTARAHALEHAREEQALLGRAEPLEAPAARTTARDHQPPRDVSMLDDDGCVGCSGGGRRACRCASTTSEPVGHLADDRVVGRQLGSSAVTTKNWLPAAPGGSAAAFAIATTPGVYCVSRRVCRRSCSRARRCRSPSGRRPGSRSPGRSGGRPCRRSSPRSPGTRTTRPRSASDFWSSVIVN